MPTPSGAGERRRRGWAAAAATFGVLAALTLPIAPALAHDQLVASTPTDGEHLEVAPTEVRLTFSDEPLEIGTTVMVTDLEGTDHAGSTRVVDRDVVTELPVLPDGHYDVRWRVVSSDGHPISGVIPFAVGDAGARPEPSSPPTPSTGSTAGPAAEQPSSPPGEPGPARTVLIAVGGAAAAVAVVALLALIDRVRRRR